jgi:predicted xylose isomerase-like sugar epimerase
MEKTWKVESIESIVSQDGYEKIVKTLHWRLFASEDNYQTSVYGSVSLAVDSENTDDFIVYEELDENTVLEWLKDAMGEEQVAAYESSVEAQIYNLQHPTVITNPLPWANT